MKKRQKPAGSGKQRPADLPQTGDLVKVSISARVDAETAEWVKGLKNKSAFLRAAIAHHKKTRTMDEEKRDLEAEYEETRQAWNNDPPPYANRPALSERLNEIRAEQIYSEDEELEEENDED